MASRRGRPGRRHVRAFSDKVFDVIEAESDRLREVDGIGPVRAKRIVEAWAEQKVVREIMMFLHANGVGTARAVRASTRPTARTPFR
jgi:exodeoxyribonuclease V alpha subunit